MEIRRLRISGYVTLLFKFYSYKIYIGDLDNGVDHLAKAVAVCSQPQSLMSLFQQTLPAELFQEIIMRLPRVAQVK